MSPVWLPSPNASSAAFTMTVCGVSALAGVNVSTLATPAPLPTSNCAFGVTVTVTFAAGTVSSTTLYVSYSPPSITFVPPPVSVIRTFGVETIDS